MRDLTRRVALKLLAVGSTLFNLPKVSASQTDTSSNTSSGLKTNGKTVSWNQMQDRVFLGGDCWANPMEDWQVVDGAAECGSVEGNRNVHLLTHQLTNVNGQVEMSVAWPQ